MGSLLLSTPLFSAAPSAVRVVTESRRYSSAIHLTPSREFGTPCRPSVHFLREQRAASGRVATGVKVGGEALGVAEVAAIGSASIACEENAVLRSMWEGEEREAEEGTFDWLTSWYPVGISADLDKKRPHQVTVLGRQYALWWDRNALGGEGQWQVFADLCPHRLAPLSEGRIHESGALQCSYHGWTFRGDASCSSIPQATPNSPPVHTKPRACAIRHPSAERYGFIWMIPSSGPKAWKKAAGSSPPAVPVLDDPDYEWKASLRDLAYGYDTLVENILDPTHVPFAHHGIQGNRNKPRPWTLVEESSSKHGFSGMTTLGKGLFSAPCVYAQELNFGTETKKMGVYLVAFAVPTMPGHSRLYFVFPQNFLKPLVQITPRWVTHMQTSNPILDSDLYILHYQERAAEAMPNLMKRTKAYYTPTKADGFVLAFRRWYETHGGGAPAWGPGVDTRLPPILPKEILLDRYNSHVVHCPSCKGAHDNFVRLKASLQVMAFAILAGLVANTATGSSVMSASLTIPLLAFGGALLLLSKWVDSILRSFHFQDYIHAYVK